MQIDYEQQEKSFFENLYAHLTDHVTSERVMLKSYMEIVDESPSDAFKFVGQLLLADEKRHHQLFELWATSVERSLSGRAVGDGIPDLDFDQVDKAVVRRGAEDLLAREKQDLGELRQLKSQVKRFKQTTMWNLLIDVMIHDTQKHILILEFVLQHV